MAIPHLRRRYRTSGSRPGLLYLFLALAGLAFYVGQHVYTGREQSRVDRLRATVDAERAAFMRLTAHRDSLLGLSVVEPQARKLGMQPPRLDQMARLPLGVPSTYDVPLPPGPPTLADAVVRVWQWLDPPTVSPTEALARP